MKKALYPGSFDPITYGHIDIVKRALQIFDEVTIVVGYNSEKTHTFFTPDERVEMIKEVFAGYNNVKVLKYEGLTVDICHELGITTIIRGLRMLTDFEYEYGMALTNKELAKDIESVYFMTNIEYTYLSSTIAKEVIKLNGDATKFMPESVIKRVKDKLK